MTSKNGRRRLLISGAAALGCAVAGKAGAAVLRVPDRRHLALHNPHTGESVDLVYWANGTYEPGALHRIDHLMRDFRTDEVRPIDRRLLDVLVQLNRRLDRTAPFQVISGYRSPQTNAMLETVSDGVAHHSLHMQGMAIDITIPDRPLSSLHRAALSLQAGGVGYYPASNFVHIDVGRVRRWG